MEVMRHHHHDSRLPYSPYPAPSHSHYYYPRADRTTPPYQPHDPRPQPRYAHQYPPSPPMERSNKVSLPPISTLLGGLRDREAPSERRNAPPTPYSARSIGSKIDSSARAPPSPPSRPEFADPRYVTAAAAAPTPTSSAAAPLPPMHSPSFPSPHERRQSSTSSYPQQSPLHRHRLSSSSFAGSTASGLCDQTPPEPRAYYAAPSQYPPPRAMHPAEYAPHTPQSPPSATSTVASERERGWPYPPPVPSAAPPSTGGIPQMTDRYICQSCAKAFSRPSSLRIHVHSHTGEKPFKCPHAGCGKAFSVRSNMRRHQRGCHVDGAPSADDGLDGDEMEMDEP